MDFLTLVPIVSCVTAIASLVVGLPALRRASNQRPETRTEVLALEAATAEMGFVLQELHVVEKAVERARHRVEEASQGPAEEQIPKPAALRGVLRD